MALADAIANPSVGKTMLTTFGTLAEENRKRAELASTMENRMQGAILKEAGFALRQSALDLQSTKAANNYDIAMQKLALATSEADRRAAITELDNLKKAFQLEQEKGDLAAAQEAAGILAAPDKDGRTLHQRLLSQNPKEAEEAMREFVGVAGRLQGRGKQTKDIFDSVRRGFNDRMRQIEGQHEAEMAAKREARLAASAESRAALGDRAQSERERHNKVVEGQGQQRLDKPAATKSAGGASTEYFPGGKATLDIPGLRRMTLDQVREALAAGGAGAEALKRALKNVGTGKTGPDGEPIPGWIDDAAIAEFERQGKTILQKKAAQPAAAQPGAGLTPSATDPLDDIFSRPVPKIQNGPGGPPLPGDVLPSLPPVPGVGAANVIPAEEFFGLPRQVTMA